MTQVPTILEKSAQALAAIAAIVLVLQLMLLMVVDVVLRSIGLGVPGAVEMVTLGTRTVFAFALPYAALRGSHVAVDVLTTAMRPGWQAATAALANAVGALVMLTGTYVVVARAVPVWQYGETTSTLNLPSVINYMPLVLGLFVSGLIFLALFAASLTNLRRSIGSGAAG